MNGSSLTRISKRGWNRLADLVPIDREHGVLNRYWEHLMLGPGFLYIILFLFIPSLVLVFYSLVPQEDGQFQIGLTLEHYVTILDTNYIHGFIFRSIRISLATTLIAFVIGFPMAYYAVRNGGWKGTLIVLAGISPLAIDIVLRTFGWFVILAPNGPLAKAGELLPFVDAPNLLYTEIGIVLGMVHIIVPFVLFPLISVLHTIPYELEEAAKDLGANRVTTFRAIILPLAYRGVAAAFLLSFLLSMAAFVTPAILGGNRRVLATYITELVTATFNWPLASALSVVLVVISVVVVIAYHLLEQRVVRGGY